MLQALLCLHSTSTLKGQEAVAGMNYISDKKHYPKNQNQKNEGTGYPRAHHYHTESEASCLAISRRGFAGISLINQLCYQLQIKPSKYLASIVGRIAAGVGMWTKCIFWHCLRLNALIVTTLHRLLLFCRAKKYLAFHTKICLLKFFGRNRGEYESRVSHRTFFVSRFLLLLQ